MKRKVLGVALFCTLLFAAILAGYWDMLNTEKLTLVRDTATNAVGEIAAVVRKDSPTASAAAPAAPAQVATPSPTAPSSGTSARIGPAAPDAALPASSAPAATAPATAAAAAVKTASSEAEPAIDILRVEPDGSTVLAGTAPAGATVTLQDGTRTLGTEVADASGAFVVVLEEPLAVGDHQIQIQAKTTDGRAVTSAETAIVSIPEKGRENELLAMIESPDKASRLINVPSAAPAEPVAEAPTAPTAAAGSPAPVAPGAEAASSAAGTPAAPLADAPEIVASAMPSPAASGTLPTAAPSLSVDAVEIEGEAVYVAGRAAGSASVRIYVDNSFLSQADRLPDDRFLMSARSKIAAGDHTVRADSLNAAGAVIARVEVPFVKPEGSAMAAVSASPEPTAPASAPVTTAPAEPATSVAPAETTSVDVAPAPAASPAAAPAAPDPATPSTEVGAAPAVGQPAPDAAATEVPVIRQLALESVNSRVIIRRGDSLWRISRNTYGQGARYTVIYLANGDQIRDPNRIYPGQVFRMPKDQAAAQ